MMGGDWGSGWMWLGGVWMLLFWVLVVLAIAALVRWLWGGSPNQAASTTKALEILHERYARGEIGREEYDRIRGDLER